MLSVIICTHNPRPEYLQRVLDALKVQTLPLVQWELLLIDNASQEPLAGRWDLSWHPNARLVREDELGLTPARLRGIRESRGEVLVFVDDDNLLSTDYLEAASVIATAWPGAGVWGAAIIEGEFETALAADILPLLGNIAVFRSNRDEWSSATRSNHALPAGAGLCVRRSVAVWHANQIKNDPLSKSLDRRGGDTSSCGDTHLCLAACDMGLLAGRVQALRLTHLIPAARLRREYFVRLMNGFGYSTTILAARRAELPPKRSLPGKVLDFIRNLRKKPFDRALSAAWQAGQRAALKDLENHKFKSRNSSS